MRNKSAIPAMKPQDVLVLLKLLLEEGNPWTQVSIAKALMMSQSEVSESLARSGYARLLYEKGRKVARQPFVDLLLHGIAWVFPQQPGSVVRGIPTAHSAPPLRQLIQSDEPYVWPYAKGSVRGHAIRPLYHSVLPRIEQDVELYEMLALVDALRVGKARERSLAVDLLKKKLL
ncbi:MAG: hypothetical protein ACK514_10690 [Bacteroidota bacterium]|jgi:hypothetical protein|nr:hypothetical protein [Flammeovirgaceae bacterium]MCZ8069660.1 hypothetical protein [Cytophagales bacterium]